MSNPSALVLHEMRRSAERWSVVPHRHDDSPDRKLAIEIIERLLPARYFVFDDGGALPWNRFPLTMSFIVRVHAAFGYGKLAQRHAYRILRHARTVLRESGYWPRGEYDGLTLYELPPQASSLEKPAADTGERLLSALARCQVRLREIYKGRDPP